MIVPLSVPIVDQELCNPLGFGGADVVGFEKGTQTVRTIVGINQGSPQRAGDRICVTPAMSPSRAALARDPGAVGQSARGQHRPVPPRRSLPG